MEKMRAFTKNDRALDANANTEETEDRTRTIIDYEVIDGPKRRRRLKKQINTKRAGGSYWGDQYSWGQTDGVPGKNDRMKSYRVIDRDGWECSIIVAVSFG